MKFHADFSNFMANRKDSQHQGLYSDGAQMNGVQPEEISRLREEIEELKSNRELLAKSAGLEKTL